MLVELSAVPLGRRSLSSVRCQSAGVVRILPTHGKIVLGSLEPFVQALSSRGVRQGRVRGATTAVRSTRIDNYFSPVNLERPMQWIALIACLAQIARNRPGTAQAWGSLSSACVSSCSRTRAGAASV